MNKGGRVILNTGDEGTVGHWTVVTKITKTTVIKYNRTPVIKYQVQVMDPALYGDGPNYTGGKRYNNSALSDAYRIYFLSPK